MGSVYVKVGIAGVTGEGDVIPERAVRREALVDTGATMTVVNREVAELAELILSKRVEFFETADGRRVKFWPASALVQVAGCRLAQIVVAVADIGDENPIILGHDYRQRTGMIVGPRDRLAGCTTYTRRKTAAPPKENARRATRARPAKRSTSTNRPRAAR